MRLGIQPPSDAEKGLVYWLNASLIHRLRQVVDGGGLGFGDGSAIDNIAGTWYTYTTNAVANTEDTITHNLGVIPLGWLEFTRDKAGILYKGATAWTTTSMYLKCNVASMTVLIFIPSPSNLAY